MEERFHSVFWGCFVLVKGKYGMSCQVTMQFESHSSEDDYEELREHVVRIDVSKANCAQTDHSLVKGIKEVQVAHVARILVLLMC